MSKWSLRFVVIGAYALMSGMPAWGQWSGSIEEKQQQIERQLRMQQKDIEDRMWLQQQAIESQIWDMERRQRQMQIDLELNQPTRRR
jgi:hypothetical protein